MLALAPRLTTVAHWRDPIAVATAVRRLLEASTEPDRSGLALVAEIDGRIKGFISAETTRHFAESDAYICELVVEERAEGNGIATRLVRAAEQWAVANGHRCITLNTGAANARARDLYRQLGFEGEDVKLTRVLQHDSPEEVVLLAPEQSVQAGPSSNNGDNTRPSRPLPPVTEVAAGVSAGVHERRWRWLPQRGRRP